MGTAIGMWICLILAVISFLVGVINGADFIGCVVGLVFVCLGIAIFNSAPPEFKQAVKDLQEKETQEKLNGGCKCPNCGMNAGYEISLLRKEGHLEEYGLDSMLIGKNYECYNCGHKW